ncbi:lipopolysaccharide biosynthesis protein [Litorilituus sediminis]|uniref:Polysaccharide biosynthesis protein n=1 Tax=Litorilituus sediminis TaxID=718192 RepID=A0A4P6P2A9_9GAMM|nr:oligosaccharide flippase family protein [Litorilituus sediminis]QBG35283.1 hypothetical protein EMK97_05900 [Litorilituus sediminis]
MHLKKSFAITFSAQLYSTVVTLIVTPLLISFVGAEGFGLIGFYLILQTWLQILDAGISGTLSRQVALSKHCSSSFQSFLTSFYKIYLIFAFIALVLLILGFTFATTFSLHWFKTNLQLELVSYCVLSMAITLSFKYLSGPLRSGLIGLECHILLGLFNFFYTTLRYPAGLGILYIYDSSLKAYFTYQAFIAVLEWCTLQALFYLKSRHAIKIATESSSPTQSSIKSLLLLSVQLSVLSILWVVVSQIDKLILSGALNLKQFGYYSLAVTVTGVMFTLNIPLNQVLMPRLTALMANKNNAKYVTILIKSVLFSILTFIPLGIFLVVFGTELVWAWTGNEEAAQEASRYISWLAIGNIAVIFMNFAFLLQFTLKNLKKHLIAYALYSAILIPLIFPVIDYYQGEGAAIFWMCHNIIFFILWGGYTFKKYLRNFVNLIFIPALITTSIFSTIVLTNLEYFVSLYSNQRGLTFLSLSFTGISCVGLLLLAALILRQPINSTIKKVSLITEK